MMETIVWAKQRKANLAIQIPVQFQVSSYGDILMSYQIFFFESTHKNKKMNSIDTFVKLM
jgi:hypothetical protein